MTTYKIKPVFDHFKTSGTFLDGFLTGSGHIHSTWLIRTAEESEPEYILQKINNEVFPPVKEMMNNIQKVTDHIRQKRKPGDSMKVLEIIGTKSGENHLADSRGNFWRMYRKINPGKSYDIAPNEKVAREAGKAFGGFIGDLRDLSASKIFPVIDGFNSIEMRFGNFVKAVNIDPAGRVDEVRQEIRFANEHIKNMRVIPLLQKEGLLPLRITHNDTKINNVLFDDQDNAVCVIDLDTVMPGLSLYDFGDTIRTAANTGEEDEADLDNVQFNLSVFKAFSDGFISKTISFLTRSEIEHLSLAPQYMTFIMGIRFLTDYIMGDTYYSTSYDKQNLRRCRAQFRLMDCMIDKYSESQDIIENIAKKY